MAERLVVIMKIPSAFFGALLKPQCAGANRNAVTVLQNVLEARLTVNKNLVSAPPKLAVD